MKTWVFCTYKWQGNPKALFLYMTKHYSATHECWWVAENSQDAQEIKNFGFERVTFNGSNRAKNLFSSADVYVSENFREKYPPELKKDAVVFNTWHGVGLKHIELAVSEGSIIADGVMRKNIRNFKLYKNQTYFLVTSKEMEDHFLKDTLVSPDKLIRGNYPRNEVYGKHKISTFELSEVLKNDKKDYRNIIFFAPTWRVSRKEGVFQYLLPSLDIVKETVAANNDLFIIKVHPLMENDVYYKKAKEKYQGDENILFWDDRFDIYEIFNKIDIAIVDYSSIFYDLLAAGVNKFIRYIPDYEEYVSDAELVGDYFELTGGEPVFEFNRLLEVLKHGVEVINNKNYLLEYFFGYKNEENMDGIIRKIDEAQVIDVKHPEFHTFDVFDTLIKRKTLAPFSIFFYVQNLMKKSGFIFPDFLKENWPRIRNQVEHDVRDMRRKTLFERKSDSLEITLDDIYKRLQSSLNLSDAETEFLKNAEISAEIEHVEPIKSRIDMLFELVESGHDVALISDMYLPENIIRAMLERADSRLSAVPLFLSASVGHQKSTGKLYKNIFFKNKYKYERWVHYGDNAHADGSVPRQLGIETVVHHMDSFAPYEKAWVDAANMNLRYDAYRLAAKMQRYRMSLLDSDNSDIFEKKYYAYAYAGSALVPYIHWVLLDSMKRGYEKVYFISRDGHFLKQIADHILERKKYPLKTGFLYGSRKAWRVPSFIDSVDPETFGPFGNFTGMDSFEDLVNASCLNEEEFLGLFPEFESLRESRHLRGAAAENIRRTLEQSETYKSRLLTIAHERREIVRKYLLQTINFDEKFAFVEFWGRGYTQDVFGRLLNDAAGRHVVNPFYYVRSFTEDYGSSLRHNFIMSSQNFSYFEPIFASTPYESIQQYSEDGDGIVSPVIVPADNEMSVHFENGLKKFAEDYLECVECDDLNFIRSLAIFAYEYQLKNSDDQFVCSVFAKLKDNMSSYGQVKETAPVLTLQELESARDKKDLDVLTSRISISLARSDNSVRDYYAKFHKKMRWPAVQVNASKKHYVVNDLDYYVRSDAFPFKAISLQENGLYMDIALNPATKRQDKILNPFEVFDVVSIDWTSNGVPRLLTAYGYVTANKEYVQKVVDDSNAESSVNNMKLILRGFNRRQIENSKKTGVIISRTENKSIANMIDAIGKIFRLDMVEVKRGRKWKKFTRNPYQFFDDAKSPSWRRMRVLFSPGHVVGKVSTRWVRRFLD
ncbi:CDP-glycerol glycerophosphotransferase family protein [Comamonas sp. UBA7528]|uniref:CDP-glycerol glycerophosphotransferase family protein n=1 Tax=Comamonas sp. UBA7528 TaxID=1946391 RepID=UPI0025BF4D0F|nr:CDP-glycerol glycerophosphotransferase family protein [Comamonas sp. UBA7528]